MSRYDAFKKNDDFSKCNTDCLGCHANRLWQLVASAMATLNDLLRTLFLSRNVFFWLHCSMTKVIKMTTAVSSCKRIYTLIHSAAESIIYLESLCENLFFYMGEINPFSASKESEQHLLLFVRSAIWQFLNGPIDKIVLSTMLSSYDIFNNP